MGILVQTIPVWQSHKQLKIVPYNSKGLTTLTVNSTLLSKQLYRAGSPDLISLP